MIGCAAHRRGLRRFLRNQTGIAAVEFALIVPFLLLAYLGATDITQALAIDRKLGQVASTVSDLVAQEKEIDSQMVEAFFQSGVAIMRPFDFEKTGLRLTIVEVDEGTTKVTGVKDHNWTGETDIGALPADMLELAEGRYLVVANASYDYQPMFSTIFNASMPLAQRSMHVVRQEVDNFGFSAGGTGGGGNAGGGDSNGGGDSGDDGDGSNDGGSDSDGSDSDGGNNGGGGRSCHRWAWWC